MNRSIFRKKQRSIALLAVALLGTACWLGTSVQAEGPRQARASKPAELPKAELTEKHQFFLEDHCYNCHDNSIQKGKVNLEALPLQITTLEQAELWQKVLNALNSGEMPPPDKKQPPQKAKADFLADLADTMVTARKVLSDAGGKITMRRLNRREYANTIEQLLGVRVDENALPEEGGSGFDTSGASLFISSDQLERYMTVGGDAIDEAFTRRTTLDKKPKTIRIEPEKTLGAFNNKRREDLAKTRERYLEWKVGFDKAVQAPENRQRLAKIRKENPNLFKRPDMLYRFAEQLEGVPDAKKFGFRDGQDVQFKAITVYGREYPYLDHYAGLPANDRGTYLMPTWGGSRISLAQPSKRLTPGRYTLRFRAGVAAGAEDLRRFIEVGHPGYLRHDFASLPLSTHEVTGTIKKPSIVETQVEIGTHSQGGLAIRERQPIDEKNLRNLFSAQKRENGYGHPPALWVDWVELVGPLPEDGPPSTLLAILQKHDNKKTPEGKRARAILSEFAFEAFRHARPEASYINRLVRLFESERKAGKSFHVALRTPLTVILASPGFLYLNEPGKEGSPRQLNDRELAVRLSYFLWSGPPDAELYKLADQKKLRSASTLRQQVDRMIADPRADAFVAGFVHQWLDMQRLDFFQFDAGKHREFDESTRAAARQEVYASFAHLLRTKSTSQGRLGHLLDTNYVIINSLLATYYDIDGVTGDEFRLVRLPKDSPRGGLLGMAAIHAMGSDGVHSSPVERGAWVLRHLLHDPPPPAPPNVPQLSRLEGEVLTARERLAAHMEEAQCASCHRKIDPIGFGLENFDAAGKWRTTDSYVTAKKRTADNKKINSKKKTWDIDASGRLHNGPAFKDYFELRDIIASREADFSRGLTEHLIEYALGRSYGFTDDPLADEIMAAAKRKQFALREFIHAIVQSDAFQSK